MTNEKNRYFVKAFGAYCFRIISSVTMAEMRNVTIPEL